MATVGPVRVHLALHLPFMDATSLPVQLSGAPAYAYMNLDLTKRIAVPASNYLTRGRSFNGPYERVTARLATPPSPICAIHISRQGDFGAVRLRASEHGRDRFGGVVVARDLGAALPRSIDQRQRRRARAPAVGAVHLEV